MEGGRDRRRIGGGCLGSEGRREERGGNGRRERHAWG